MVDEQGKDESIDTGEGTVVPSKDSSVGLPPEASASTPPGSASAQDATLGATNVSPPPAPTQEGKSQEYVQIPRDEWEKMQQRLEMVVETADKGRVARWHARHKAHQNRQCRLTSFMGTVVVGWRIIEDLGVEQDANGRWIEKQVIELLTSDNKKHQMSYVAYVRRHDKVNCEILKENKEIINEKEHTMFTLKVIDKDHKQFGEEFIIDKQFIN